MSVAWEFVSKNPLLAELASFALEVGQRARTETIARFRREYSLEDKATGGLFDPVTDADRAAEQAMRQLIRERFPAHSITGEELPDHTGTSRYLWSLDPIDGTRSYICGLPTWTTLVALLDEDVPVLGLVDAPSLDEIYVGFEGRSCLLSAGERSDIRTSGCARLAEARLSTTDPALFEADAAEAFDRLRQQVMTVRYGHDAYAYARLAAGSLDLVVESGLKAHDYNALIPLVSAAGGTIGDWHGGQDYIAGKVIAASTRQLFDEALSYFEALA
jgi:myo-inositol-1(or 4)-monophosphatase